MIVLPLGNASLEDARAAVVKASRFVGKPQAGVAAS